MLLNLFIALLGAGLFLRLVGKEANRRRYLLIQQRNDAINAFTEIEAEMTAEEEQAASIIAGEANLEELTSKEISSRAA